MTSFTGVRLQKHLVIPGYHISQTIRSNRPAQRGSAAASTTANNFAVLNLDEGIGFYAEEMMLQAGLYDDSPRTREIIYNFARLRSLRVEVDVKLALGEFTIAQAAAYLANTVPMDRKTAESEAAAFATAPGLGLDYEIGKLQIAALLADVRLQQAAKFNLRAFHDFLWRTPRVFSAIPGMPISIVIFHITRNSRRADYQGNHHSQRPDDIEN